MGGEKLRVFLPRLLGLGPFALPFAQIGDDEEELAAYVVLASGKAKSRSKAGIGFYGATARDLCFAEKVVSEWVGPVLRDRLLVGLHRCGVVARHVRAVPFGQSGCIRARARPRFVVGPRRNGR
jgi:hypothetical protein